MHNPILEVDRQFSTNISSWSPTEHLRVLTEIASEELGNYLHLKSKLNPMLCADGFHHNILSAISAFMNKAWDIVL